MNNFKKFGIFVGLMFWLVCFLPVYAQNLPDSSLIKLLNEYAIEFKTDSVWIEIESIYPKYVSVKTKCIYDINQWRLYAFLPLENPSFEDFILWLRKRGKKSN